MNNTVIFGELKNYIQLPETPPEDFQISLYTLNDVAIPIPANSTAFGFVLDGDGFLCQNGKSFPVDAGMFFSCLEGKLTFENIKGIVIIQKNFNGIPLLGGPIEAQGRLEYIDGCSDTLLISPLLLGDPCLNHLHIPPGTKQTPHTHPSLRCGLIYKGSGLCKTPTQEIKLEAGMFFYIPSEAIHSFYTSEKSLDVIAFHPDSDFGPTNKNHPMVNKTMINGISASQI